MGDPGSGWVVGVLASLPLHREALLEVAGRAGSPDQPVHVRPVRRGEVRQARDLTVLLADVESEGVFEAAREVAVPSVLWGGHLHQRAVAELRDHGVRFYVSGLASAEQVVLALRRARRADEPVATPSRAGRTLSPREREALVAYVVEHPDLPRREVAALLGISENTLRVHLSAVRRSIGADGRVGRAGLRRLAEARGLLADQLGGPDDRTGPRDSPYR